MHVTCPHRLHLERPRLFHGIPPRPRRTYHRMSQHTGRGNRPSKTESDDVALGTDTDPAKAASTANPGGCAGNMGQGRFRVGPLLAGYYDRAEFGDYHGVRLSPGQIGIA